jgi:hypothetical protein
MLAQHNAKLLLLELMLLLLLDVLLYLMNVGLAARLHLPWGPETVGIHPVLYILGLRDREQVLVVPIGPGPPSPAPNHGPGLPLNGEASPCFPVN